MERGLVPWRDKFELILSLGFTGLADRSVLMRKEFERVGIRQLLPIWQFPTPYDRIIQRSVPCRCGMGCIGYFNSGMGHYRAVKTAYHLGAKTCLIVEDDIRFLKDLSRLEAALDSLPADWNIALLDVLKSDKDPVSVVVDNNASNRVNGQWCRSWGNPRSFGCYALDRAAMEWLIGRIEAPALAPGVILRNVDLNLRADRVGDLKLYYAAPNLAVQTIVNAREFNSAHGDLFKYYRFYEAIGVNLDDYEGVELLDAYRRLPRP